MPDINMLRNGWIRSRRSAWGPNGFNKPLPDYWKTKDGREIPIAEMEDTHIINAMKFLNNKFGDNGIENWPVYKSLIKEAQKRNIDERIEWDS